MWFYLLAAGTASFDAVAAFDHISLEADGAGSTMQFQKETAGIAEDSTRLIASPEWCSAGRAVLADGLYGVLAMNVEMLKVVMDGFIDC